MKIGPLTVDVPVLVAPMAGMTDLPFRELCRREGAGYAVGEMTASQPALRETKKSSTRWACDGESGLKVVQLLGADPRDMADAALYAADSGADVVDLNMGCPAKKVLNRACGSALMREPALVAEILKAVTAVCPVPVTLKMRTGWDAESINAPELARLAEELGIAMVVVHGRTREAKFTGHAEYDTIKAVKAAVSIPVIANGDIDSGEKARFVVDYTGVDGVMVGRAAYGNPWIFGEVAHALGFQSAWAPPTLKTRFDTIREHLAHHMDYYGETGLRTFRKHLRAYVKPLEGHAAFLSTALIASSPEALLSELAAYEEQLLRLGA